MGCMMDLIVVSFSRDELDIVIDTLDVMDESAQCIRTRLVDELSDDLLAELYQSKRGEQ